MLLRLDLQIQITPLQAAVEINIFYGWYPQSGIEIVSGELPCEKQYAQARPVL